MTVGDELLSAFKVASFAAFEEESEPVNQPNDNDDESKDWVSVTHIRQFIQSFLRDMLKLTNVY